MDGLLSYMGCWRGEEEGEVIPPSVGEGEGLLVLLQLYPLQRRWEAAWEGLAPCWGLRCHLPWHHYCCQTGLREEPSFWVSLYFRMKLHSSKGNGGRKSYFPIEGFPACILCVACDWDKNGAGGGESYKAYRVRGSHILSFPSAFVISQLSERSLELLWRERQGEESTPITLTQLHSFSKLHRYFYFIVIWTAEHLAIVTTSEACTLHLCVCFQLGSDLVSWKTYHHAAFKQSSKLNTCPMGRILPWHLQPGSAGCVTQTGGVITKHWTAKNHWYLSANSQQSFVKLPGWPAFLSHHCCLFNFFFTLNLFPVKNHWGQTFS